MRKIKGANMDIDLSSKKEKICWEQGKCPWNEAEGSDKHKCAVKNISICKYFKGVKEPDIVLCDFPE
ncbi:hypothetical protein KY330_04470 [Candidatus Woesearchaeota archaeon]|nr:hypothetical protein [Candidatus Woesearchaeota archaeon]